jgi:hypothetical protein
MPKLTRGNLVFQGLDFAALFNQVHPSRVCGVDTNSWKKIQFHIISKINFRKECVSHLIHVWY